MAANCIRPTSARGAIFLGWNAATVLGTPGKYDVKATALPGAEIYRINFPGVSAGEYLLIENRQPIGIFEGGIVAGSDGVFAEGLRSGISMTVNQPTMNLVFRDSLDGPETVSLLGWLIASRRCLWA